MNIRIATKLLICLAAASQLAAGLTWSATPPAARAQSEASSEAPMFIGGTRRRGRRRGGRNAQWQKQQNQMALQEQKHKQQQQAGILKADQKDANQRARRLQNLKPGNVIHEYGKGAKQY